MVDSYQRFGGTRCLHLWSFLKCFMKFTTV